MKSKIDTLVSETAFLVILFACAALVALGVVFSTTMKLEAQKFKPEKNRAVTECIANLLPLQPLQDAFENAMRRRRIESDCIRTVARDLALKVSPI
jgi:hypothetical protein